MNDFKRIYELAMSNDQLNIALKAKELMIKLSENNQTPSNYELSNEDIEKYINLLSKELSA